MNLKRVVTPFIRGLMYYNGGWGITKFGSHGNFKPYEFIKPSEEDEERVDDFFRRYRGPAACYWTMNKSHVEFATAKVCPAVVHVSRCPAVVHVSRRMGIGGSGIIIDSEGTVLTCAENIFPLDDGSKINVILPDRRKFPATILEANTSHGLALLKIQTEIPLPKIWIGSIKKCPGSKLISIEHPLEGGIFPRPSSQHGVDEKDLMFSHGEISSNFEIGKLAMGAVGGPLVNLDGEVVGICTQTTEIGDILGTITAMTIEEAFRRVGYVRRK